MSGPAGPVVGACDFGGELEGRTVRLGRHGERTRGQPLGAVMFLTMMGVVAFVAGSAELDAGFSAGGRLDLDGGVDLVLLAVVGLLVAEEDGALAAGARVVGGQFAVQFVLSALLLLRLPPQLRLLLLLGGLAQHDVALVVVLHSYFNKALPVLPIFFASLAVLGSPHPSDQFDAPPGPWCTFTLVFAVSPMLNSLLFDILQLIFKRI